MLTHIFIAGICLALPVHTCAYQITEPSDRDLMEGVAWTSTGPNDIKWERVSTDPEEVTIVLVNEERSLLPELHLLLAENVDGTLLHVTVSAAEGTQFPMGAGFRVNFVKSKEDLNTIYAQSSQFRIVEGSSSAASSQSGSTTHGSQSNSTQAPRATYVAPAETVTVTATLSSSTPSKIGFRFTSILEVIIGGVVALALAFF